MKSVKLHSDTVDLLRAYCRRTGKTYDSVIRDLIGNQQAAGEMTLAAADRLRRMEELLLSLVDQASASYPAPTLHIP